VNAVFCFLSTFVAVFALGFQSQNVNQGHYWAAALTSVAIGASSIILYKLMPDSSTLEILGYLVGGVTGITASMWVHRRTLGRSYVNLAEKVKPETPRPPGPRIVREGVVPQDDTH
jgi:hypothetical protein